MVDVVCSVDHTTSKEAQIDEIPIFIAVDFIVYTLTQVEKAGNKKKRVKVDKWNPCATPRNKPVLTRMKLFQHTWESFVNEAFTACNGFHKDVSLALQKAHKDKSLDFIGWINGVDGYKKGEKTGIENEIDFDAWRVASLQVKNPKMGIKIVQPDPALANKKRNTVRCF